MDPPELAIGQHSRQSQSAADQEVPRKRVVSDGTDAELRVVCGCIDTPDVTIVMRPAAAQAHDPPLSAGMKI
jgi:hypothetical protein